MELYQNLCRLRRRTLSPPPLHRGERFGQTIRPPLVDPLRTSALYCTSSALSPEETPEFPRNFTESTIVGYSQYALTKANQFVTTSFKNIGDGAIDLTNIKVVGYAGATSDKASVQFIDATGNTAKDSAGKSRFYFWRDADGSSGKWIKKDGRNIIDVVPGEATLGVGDALWWQKKEDGLSLQFAGAVIEENTDVMLPLANQAVGNMMAVPIDLTAITVAGYTGATSDKVSAQIIDGSGNTAKDDAGKSKFYFWRDSNGSSGKWVKKDGRNIIDVVVGEVVLNPGDGIWVQNKETATAYKLVFPAPTL